MSQKHRLHKIELDNGHYINTHYEYGIDEMDALKHCLEKHELLKVKIKDVHPATKAELLDAAKG